MALGIGGERQFGKLRFRVVTLLVALALGGLVVRLYVVQVVRHAEFRQKSESNFIQARRIHHDRGTLRDREGRVLVENRPSHDVSITPAFMPDARALISKLLTAAGSAQRSRELADELLRRVDLGEPQPMVLVPALPGEFIPGVTAVINDMQVAGVDTVPQPGGETALILYPLEFPSSALVFRRMEQLLDLADGGLVEVREKVARVRGLNRFAPIVVRQNLAWETDVRISHSASLGELPGVEMLANVVRGYRHQTQAAHLLGYMNEISKDELENTAKDSLASQGYLLGDYLGRRGIEKKYEKWLRGKDGQEKVVVDAKGRRMHDALSKALLGDERRVEPVSGTSLTLTLDLDLQRAAEESFRGKAGAVVAVEVATGSILAMASFPTYDPNLVSGRMSASAQSALNTDPLHPWVNKAIQEHYSPGSTFKVVTAISGLLEGKIGPETVLPCPGFFSLGRTQWRCFNRFGHGGMALQRSIQVSCDAFYYRLGYMVGENLLALHAGELGLGQLTGIGLDGEKPGLIADEMYYKMNRGGYQGGYVVNNAIGQGDVLVTPLQLAMAYATVVNGGTLYEPRLVLRTQDGDGNVLQEIEPKERRKVKLPDRGMKELMAGLSEVVKGGGTAAGVMYKEDPPGLGLWMRTSGIAVAGKTGTAQVAHMSKSVLHVEASKTEYLLRDHAWFAGFAPLDKPEIVVVTLTEHGGFGGSVSAPVSVSVMRKYFEKKGYPARPQLDRPRVMAVKAVEAPVVPEAVE